MSRTATHGFPLFCTLPRPHRALDAVQHKGKGWPDLFLAHPDRGVMAIECKSRRGRLTPEQSDWLDTLAAAGVDVVVAAARQLRRNDLHNHVGDVGPE